MKVRISGNKIRLRLKEPEVKSFEKTGIVTEVLAFGDSEASQLKFTLMCADVEAILVRFENNETSIVVPQLQAAQWTSTEQVGFDADIDTDGGKTVSILVEKDFVCLHGPEEDNVGSYPNPQANVEA